MDRLPCSLILFQAGIKRPALTDIKFMTLDHVWSREKPTHTLTPIIRQMQILAWDFPALQLPGFP